MSIQLILSYLGTKGSGRANIITVFGVISIQVELFRMTQHENFPIAIFAFYIYYKSICTFRDSNQCYLKHLHGFLSCSC